MSEGRTQTIIDLMGGEQDFHKGIENGITVYDVAKSEGIDDPSKEYIRGIQATISYVCRKMMKDYDIIMAGISRAPTTYFMPKNSEEERMVINRFLGKGTIGNIKRLRKMGAQYVDRKLLDRTIKELEDLQENLEKPA